MDEKFSFKEIEQARKILGLGIEVTMKDIKRNYRKLALKFHPDRCKEKAKKRCEKKFKEIQKSYEIIMKYCINYRFSFRKEEVKKTDIDEEYHEHLRRFYDGWWADIDDT